MLFASTSHFYDPRVIEVRNMAYNYQRTSVPNLFRQEPSGRFYGRWLVAGKDIWRSHRTKNWTVAKRRHAKLDKKINTRRRTADQAAVRLEGKVSMEQFIAVYRERLDAMEAAKEKKPETIKTRRDGLKKLLQVWPELPSLDPDRIRPEEVVDFSRKLKAGGHGKMPGQVTKIGRAGNSASSVNRAIDALGYLFEIAVRFGACTSSPVVDQPRDVHLKKTPEEKKLVIPDRSGVIRLLHAIEANGAAGMGGVEAANLCRFLMFSGARIGESAKALWKHVDFVNNRMWIDGYKTESSARHIPLFPDLADLLQKVKAHREWVLREGRGVFACGPENRIWRFRECQRSIDSAAKRSGVTRITHHDFRHLFVTRCLENPKIGFHTIADWVGHKNARLIIKTYGHLRDDHSQEQALLLSFGDEARASSLVPLSEVAPAV